MKPTYNAVLISLMALSLSSTAQDATSSGVRLALMGTGTSTLATANSSVAIVQDATASFANPAGISFVKSREFTASIEGFSNTAETQFRDEPVSDVLRRFRVGHAGFLYPFPTSRGGLAISAIMHSPYVYDDLMTYSGTKTIGGVENYESYDYRIFGNVRYWTGALAAQVAPGLSVGGALSLVTSSDKTRIIGYKLVDRAINDPLDDTDQLYTRNTVGYDLRMGIMYRLMEQFHIGARLVFPQRHRFEENLTEDYPHQPQYASFNDTYEGRMYSSFSGAGGLGVVFPFASLSVEGRARLPYDYAFPSEDIPQSSTASSYKVGASVGVDIPISATGLRLKGGYAWDEYDPFSRVAIYDFETALWDDPRGLSVISDRNQVTAGISYLSGKMLLDIAYGYQFWELLSKTLGGETVAEEHAFHRFGVSLSVRY